MAYNLPLTLGSLSAAESQGTSGFEPESFFCKERTCRQAIFLWGPLLKIDPEILAFLGPGKKINFLLLSNLLNTCKLGPTLPRANTGRQNLAVWKRMV